MKSIKNKSWNYKDMVEYRTSLEEIEESQLEGFFVGWPNPPTIKTFQRLLKGSYKYILALEENRVVGFINAVSDGVLSAYIPLLEVLPTHQSKGIGGELVKRMQAELSHLYMVDLLCDKELVPYYEKLGMHGAQGAFIRNYDAINNT